MKVYFTAVIFLMLLSCTGKVDRKTVTTESLISEMADLERLTVFPLQNYRTIQYSSYDRRSTSPSRA